MPDTAEAVAQYGSAVYRLAYAMTRSRSDADDVFQEVFLRLHRSAPDFANEEHRRAWLLRVTANCARSLLASPWRMRTLPLEDVYSYQDSVESAVDEALAHLPGKYRAVIHLFYQVRRLAAGQIIWTFSLPSRRRSWQDAPSTATSIPPPP